ncbi:DUF2917 domain-containing protein [Aquabacterium sp. OR-4]|uniref:DUF2917 domain-containing protein n=1 Tax=Aquabacterium sp. OR-4 TaxID=2978127 RepID=UPI0021B3C8EE|nr:DUF2917 domain-containing protein [Aquabacterium sp. OR-4]MDT7835572.1 DUF2917 domain-containing protein [Aquabacterium sp. OR-4]
MHTTTPVDALIELAPGQALTLPRGHGLLQVLSGRVWLTCPGDPDDHFIGAGQAWPLPRLAGVVIECDGAVPARLRLPAVARQRAGLPLSGGSAACR